MKIPDKVKIGGINYRINKDVERLQNGIDCSAEIDYRRSSIDLLKGIEPQRQRRDFIHELVHGIFDNLGYEAPEEKQIDELAGALYQLIVDNPEMFGD